MFIIGITSFGFLSYGIYLFCYDNEIDDINETNDLTILDQINQQQGAPSNTVLDQQRASSQTVFDEESIEDTVVEDLWSSYHLEKKYDEMKEKRDLRQYLSLTEWKKKIRHRFKNIFHSKEYKRQPLNYIQSNRQKRNKNEYAVVEDTVLNLLEHYEILSQEERINK